MLTPQKPIIDARTTVADERPSYSPPGKSGPEPKETIPQQSNNTDKMPQPNPTGVNTSVGNGQQPSAFKPEGSGSTSSSSVQTKASVPISYSVPEEFKGTSNQELIDFLERKIKEFKPMSKEDLEKLRRRQKTEGIISGISDAVRAISNMAFTTQYAPNMYNPTESMSKKAKERFDKEKADRDAEEDKYFNYAITLGKLRDADKQRGLDAWKTEQTLAREDRAYDAGRKDRDDDVKFRDKDFDERMRQWQTNFDRQGEWHKEEGERWEKQFKESVRQFNVSAANERARIGLEAQRLAHALKEGQMTFNLGSGNGNVTLSLDKLNAQTVSRIFSTLPDDVRSKVQGDPIVQNGFVTGYKDPSTEAMLIAIGANVETSPATQNAIRQVAGLEKGTKPAAY